MVVGFVRRNLRFGILQRYVMGEVLRAFSLALLTITAVFVLLTVMGKAASIGLDPYEILKLIPYMIPASLPYTVPVSLLFAATVVYGRLAGDNEVIAVKTAGLSAMILIWPSILISLVFSVALNHLSATFIPNSVNSGKKVIYQNFEAFFYKKLKMDRVLDSRTFLIKVKDVQGKIMIEPIFKKRSERPETSPLMPRAAESADAEPEMVVTAKRARLDFDFDQAVIHAFFIDCGVRQAGVLPSEGNFREFNFDIAIPGEGKLDTGKTVEEMTVDELRALEAKYLEDIAMERKRQAVAAAWFLGSGRPSLVKWDQMQAAFGKYDYWKSECKKFETEIQMRQAMAWGSFFFVIVGAPVGILFARRDFLSAFISCFLPIILVYYPLTLFGVNLGKEGIVPPELVWTGNVVLWLAAFIWALPPVRKH